MHSWQAVAIAPRPSEYAFLQHLQQVCAVAAVFCRRGYLFYLYRGDVAISVGDLFRTSDHQSLPLFDCLNVQSGFHQRFVRSSVEPGHAASHHDYLELSLLQIDLVHVRDFQLTARARLERLGNANDLIIVKVKTRDGVPGLRLPGLFFQAQSVACAVELYYPVSLRIAYRIGEHARTLILLRRLAKIFRQIVPIKNVVAQDQRTRAVAQKSFADQEGLCDALRLGLNRILQPDSILRAVPQQGPKPRHVVGSRDDQNFPNAREHERAERVINHRFVVDRQQAFAHSLRDWVQARARTAGENDSFIARAFGHSS